MDLAYIASLRVRKSPTISWSRNRLHEEHPDRVEALTSRHLATGIFDRPSCGRPSYSRMERNAGSPTMRIYSLLRIYSDRTTHTIQVHLLSMTTGQPHPAAELPSFSEREPGRFSLIHSVSITSFRFAMLVCPLFPPKRTEIVVWD